MTDDKTADLLQQLYDEDPEKFLEKNKKLNNLMMHYRCALREIQTKLEILDDEFSNTYQRNPIATIKTRIKKPASIFKKLKKKGVAINVDNINLYINDVAGIRVTCPFIDDIYVIADLLAAQDDINVITIKDYIKNPKDNGYRSYHMIVEVPVFFAEGKTPMKVEIQIRTIGMDFWASLEHQIHYKKEVDNIKDLAAIEEELHACAHAISNIDTRMQNVKQMIGKFQNLS